jgi:hypothetical protein
MLQLVHCKCCCCHITAAASAAAAHHTAASCLSLSMSSTAAHKHLTRAPHAGASAPAAKSVTPPHYTLLHCKCHRCCCCCQAAAAAAADCRCAAAPHLSVTMSSTAPSVDVWLKVRAARPSSSSHTNLQAQRLQGSRLEMEALHASACKHVYLLPMCVLGHGNIACVLLSSGWPHVPREGTLRNHPDQIPALTLESKLLHIALDN